MADCRYCALIGYACPLHEDQARASVLLAALLFFLLILGVLATSGCVGPLLPLPTASPGAHLAHCGRVACPDAAARVAGTVVRVDYRKADRTCLCEVDDWRNLRSVIEVPLWSQKPPRTISSGSFGGLGNDGAGRTR